MFQTKGALFHIRERSIFESSFKSRLTSVTGPGISASYVYNGLDTRISKVENSVSQTFVRDGAYVTDPVLRDSTASYTPGLSTRVGAESTFMHSGLKNIMVQTDAAGSTSSSKTYDAFGNLVASSGTWSGPFGYAGGFGYQEDATGLKLLGHRYYDSSTGRFLTRDPIKDGRNYYVYCENKPLQAADPDGLRWVLYNPGGWYWECPLGGPPPASPRPKPGESMAEYQARLGLEAGETNQGPPGYGIGNPGLNGGTPLNGGENKIQPSPGGTGKGGTGNSGEYGGKLGGKGGNGKKGTVKYEQPIGNGGKITIGYGWGQEPSGFSIGLTWVWRLN